MAHFSGARRMLATGGGSSSGMDSPASSCRRPLLGAEESEGLLQEFGEPGHWSACSLANRRGGLPASGSLLGLLSAPTRRLGGGVTLPCRGGTPSALRPSYGCRSPEISGGQFTRRRRGAAGPLPNLPTTVGRLHNSMLCPVVVEDGEGFISYQAGWSCSQDEPPCLGGGRLEWCAWKLPRPTEGDHGPTSSAQGRYPGAGISGEFLG